MDEILDQDTTVFVNAGAGSRFLAYLIDIILLSVVGIGVSFALGEGIGTGDADATSLETLIAPYYSFSFYINMLIVLFYFTFFEASNAHATLGKQALGIKVIKADGGEITTSGALIRNLTKTLLYYTYIGILTYLMVFTSSRRTLHDMAGGTRVVQA